MATNPTRRRRAPGRRPALRPDEVTLALDAIRRIVQTLRVSARVAERRLGVSGAQLFVLHSLAEGPAESLNELAARTYTHQSSVSVVVERLVRRRLVSRHQSALDGRRVRIELTPTGRELLRSSPEVAQVRLIRALRALPRRDSRELARILAHVGSGLGAEQKPALFFEDGDARRRAAGTAPAHGPRATRAGADSR